MIILRGDEINNIVVGTIFMKINRNNYNPNKPNQTDTPPLKNLYVKHEPEEMKNEDGKVIATNNITQLSVQPNGTLKTTELNSNIFRKYEWFFKLTKNEAEDIIRYFEWALSGCSKEKERKTIKQDGSDTNVGTA